MLVTRAAENAAALSRPLRSAGLIPVELPLICRETVSRAIPVDARHDLVVITSAAAVPALVEARGRGWTAPAFAAVGPASARAARAAGFNVTTVPPKATVIELLDALQGLSAKRVLYPRAEVVTSNLAARLQERGARVDDVVVYRNRQPSDLRSRLIEALPVDVITLLSGSAAQRLGELVSSEGIVLKSRIVVIGPSTAEAAHAVGLNVDSVACPHTVPGVVDAVLRLVG